MRSHLIQSSFRVQTYAWMSTHTSEIQNAAASPDSVTPLPRKQADKRWNTSHTMTDSLTQTPLRSPRCIAIASYRTRSLLFGDRRSQQNYY